MIKNSSLIVLATVFLCAPVKAAIINGTGNVTSDVIFGSGNSNGSFTGYSDSFFELALRGKLRFNSFGSPENTFNYNGENAYTFLTSDGSAPLNRSLFNFEWSINVDPLGTGNRFLSDFTYLIQIDYDPSAAVRYFDFDPVNQPYVDNAVGNNSSGNGGGVKAALGDSSGYQALLNTNSVAQNSWNLGFFSPMGFDPQTLGTYTIRLSAYDNNVLAAETAIDIIYREPSSVSVPEPSALMLMFAGLFGLGAVARRRRLQK